MDMRTPLAQEGLKTFTRTQLGEAGEIERRRAANRSLLGEKLGRALMQSESAAIAEYVSREVEYAIQLAILEGRLQIGHQ